MTIVETIESVFKLFFLKKNPIRFDIKKLQFV